MRMLNISISDVEYNQFGIKSDKLSFSELVDIVNRKLIKANLQKTVELAEKYNLSKMSIEEISNEVKTVRKSAEGRN
ncbi:MAG: hypothetical protein ABS46_07400 [Cytophagaceae bacterium SCN 52-12]|nr:MAG: hypothetical protein ABS46_07400 [Cytophagaceae bacterium SCN 52-12]